MQIVFGTYYLENRGCCMVVVAGEMVRVLFSVPVWPEMDIRQGFHGFTTAIDH